MRAAQHHNTPQSKQRALDALQAARCLPSVVAFDADFVLWRTHAEFYRPSSHPPALAPDVPPVFDALEAKHLHVALASRTPTPDVCVAWLHKHARGLYTLA